MRIFKRFLTENRVAAYTFLLACPVGRVSTHRASRLHAHVTSANSAVHGASRSSHFVPFVVNSPSQFIETSTCHFFSSSTHATVMSAITSRLLQIQRILSASRRIPWVEVPRPGPKTTVLYQRTPPWWARWAHLIIAVDVMLMFVSYSSCYTYLLT